VGGENPVYDISLEATFDNPERVVMLVVHEKDGQIRTDCKTKALSRRGSLTGKDIKPTRDSTHQKERIDDGVYQSH
jgi:hypothetical protein